MEIFMEFRPGAGGDEAFSFMEELILAYGKYGRKMGMEIDIPEVDSKAKLIVFSGKNAKALLNEGGVHRVQRESKGKLHTSTVTINVFEGVKEGFEVSDKDFKFDTYRASGAGGQHRNTTDSAIRLTHMPTGIVVTCCSERSQHKNKATAISVMMNRLRERNQDEIRDSSNNKRHEQVGSGDRAEARRTFNYHRKEVVDNLTGSRIPLKEFLKGNFILD